MASEGDREDTPLGPGLTQQQTMPSGFSASAVVITLELNDAQETSGDRGGCVDFHNAAIHLRRPRKARGSQEKMCLIMWRGRKNSRISCGKSIFAR